MCPRGQGRSRGLHLWSATWPSENVPRFVQQNCERNWITVATLTAGLKTWKRATLPATHLRRSF